MSEISPEEGTNLEELNEEGVGMGIQEEPNTFEPEEEPDVELADEE